MQQELYPNHLDVGDDLGDAIVTGKATFFPNDTGFLGWFKPAYFEVPIIWKSGLQAEGIRTLPAKKKVTVDVMDPI